MLRQTTLLDQLQRFADPNASVFEGWPLDRETARHRWAHAFATYASDMVDTAPVLAPHGVSVSFDAVEAQFFATLVLVNATVDAAATDFTNAWRAAIAAIAPRSSATSGGTTFTFVAMDATMVDSRANQLHAALVHALTTARTSSRDDLSELADAFHAATSGLISTATPFAVTYS